MRRILAALAVGSVLALSTATPALADKPTPDPAGAFIRLDKITPDGATVTFRCDATAAANGDKVDIYITDYISVVARQDLVPDPDQPGGGGLLIPCASDNSVQTVTGIPIEDVRRTDCAVRGPYCLEPLVEANTRLYGVTTFLAYSATPVDQQTRARYDTVRVVKK